MYVNYILYICKLYIHACTDTHIQAAEKRAVAAAASQGAEAVLRPGTALRVAMDGGCGVASHSFRGLE